MGPPQCEVCSESASRYKCPSCLIPYCSIGCFKKHKEHICVKPKSSDADQLSVAVKPTPNSQSLEERPILVDEPSEVLEHDKLESIASCSEIRDALKNQDLRKLIYTIDSSPNPEEELDKAMGSDMFRIFTDKVLSAANR